MTVIEDAGHWVNYECAGEFNRALLDAVRS